MKTYFFFTILIVWSTASLAQKLPIKFGTVTTDELAMTHYPADSSASAVILADIGESKIVYSQGSGFSINFERTTRIKILTKDGLQHANFEIPLYHSGNTREKVVSLKGITYNLEGGKIIETKLKNDGIFEEKYTANIDLTKVTMPAVKAGSVVDLTYTLNSEFLVNFYDWQFQAEIPTKWSEYRASIPEYFRYQQYMQGYVVPTVNETKQRANSIVLQYKERSGSYVSQTTFDTEKVDFTQTDHRWVAENVPAFKPEPYITTSRDYISKINFELAAVQMPQQPVKAILGSWEEINTKLDNDAEVGGAVRGNGHLKKVVESITSETAPEEERVKAIYSYVRSNFTWNGKNGISLSSSLKTVVDEKQGSSADLNLLLLSMLDKAGIKVSPVIISTRDHGFVRESVPVSTQFNSLIALAYIGDKYITLDATDKLLPIGVLPERCLNGKGLAISKQGHSWIPLETRTKSKTVFSADLEIAEGHMAGKLRMDHSGYNAAKKRREFLSGGQEEYIKKLSEKNHWALSKSEFKNVEDIGSVLTETHEMTTTENMVPSGDVIYVDPFVAARLKANPFKSEKREYPVDYGSPIEETYMCKFKVPAGYKVEELPQSKAFALADNAGRYALNVSQQGEVVTITSVFAINRTLFSQFEYPNLREFYSQVVAKQSEQIVLRKQ